MARLLLHAVSALLTLMAASVSAQDWSVDVSDDGGYAAGRISLPYPAMSVTCAARSVRNLPLIDTMWFESSVPPPWFFSLGIADRLMATDAGVRADVTLTVDGVGYRLPPIVYDDYDGGWGIDLPMTDGLFAALAAPQRVVLRMGSDAAWEMPVAGLGAALAQARQHCAATWAVTGPPPPPGLGMEMPLPTAQSGVVSIPPAIPAHVTQGCGVPAAIPANAIQAGDLDSDGAPDFVLDWGAITCPGTIARPFCGAANCSHDVFLSSRGFVDPRPMLGMSVNIIPHPRGGLALSIAGSFSLCGVNGEYCAVPLAWNGSSFVERP